jgi:hypothetical protein
VRVRVRSVSLCVPAYVRAHTCASVCVGVVELEVFVRVRCLRQAPCIYAHVYALQHNLRALHGPSV